MNHELLSTNKISPVALATLKQAKLDMTPQALLDAFLSEGRNVCTRKAYTQDINDFRAFLQVKETHEAVSFLLSLGVAQANAIATSYKNHLRQNGKSAATTNRRLDTLSSLTKLAAKVGLLSYQLSPDRLPREKYRDTRGPGKEVVQQLLALLKESENEEKRARDIAIVRLLFDLALRQNEALSLDLSHVNEKQKTISILGKGRTSRELLELPAPTYQALQEWISHRGTHAGPLFVSLDYSAPGHRLTSAALKKILDKLGARLGVKIRPHGLRHSAITAALELRGVREVQQFSRHKDLNVLCVYDDNRKNVRGQIASQIALLP
jgi:integrase/recombinase XerC